MTENFPIEELLKQYPCTETQLQNLELAKNLFSENYSTATPDVLEQVLNFHVIEHFKMDGKSVKVLKLYLKEMGKQVKESKKESKKEAKAELTKEEKDAKLSFEAHQNELVRASEEAKKNEDEVRKASIRKIECTLKNEDGSANIEDILEARKQLKEFMKHDFWTIEGMNVKSGNAGHLSLRKIAIADYIYKAYNIVRYNGRNWWYDWQNAYYRYDNDDLFLNQEVSAIMKEVGGEVLGETYKYNGNSVGDCKSILKLAYDTDVYIDNPFNREFGCINARNGVIKLDYENRTRTLIGKKPSYKFSYCIDTIYNKNAKNDRIYYELVNMVGMYPAELLVQMFAIAIRDSDPELDPSKMIYVLMGKGDAGKGVFQKLAEVFLGRTIVSHAKLLDIVDNKFIKASLEGKLMNIDPELPEQLPLTESGELKALSGGKIHRIEEKGVKGYDGIITAIMVFAGNQFPRCSVSKNDTAFWDRWEIIDFPKKFKRTANFTKELLTEENLSCFFNRVIEKLFDLHEGKLLRNKQSFDVYTRWMSDASTVFKFVDKMTDVCEGEKEYTKEEFFGHYHKWCDFMKIPQSERVRNISAFTTELEYKCGIKVGRTGSYIKNVTDTREYVYRMHRVYMETNAIEPEEPVYVTDEYVNERGDIVEVLSIIDEDGSQRIVNEFVKI